MKKLILVAAFVAASAVLGIGSHHLLMPRLGTITVKTALTPAQMQEIAEMNAAARHTAQEQDRLNREEAAYKDDMALHQLVRDMRIEQNLEAERVIATELRETTRGKIAACVIGQEYREVACLLKARREIADMQMLSGRSMDELVAEMGTLRSETGYDYRVDFTFDRFDSVNREYGVQKEQYAELTSVLKLFGY